MDKEIWKDVPFDNNYMASNLGKIYSKRSGKILQGDKTRKGYIRVGLTGAKRKLVHDIIAITFIPNPENKPQVNHKDGNKKNNRVDNLEWNTQSENMRHALDNKLKVMPRGKNVYNATPVIQLDLEGNVIREWECQTDVERELGIKQGCISRVCLGKRETTGGYKWKFKKGEEKMEQEKIIEISDIQTKFNEDSIDILVEDGEVENVYDTNE